MATSSAALGSRLQAIEVTPALRPEHRLLNAFVGEWTAEGRTEATASRLSENITHQHTYEWLPGGFHMLHRWNGHIGKRESKGVEIIGYDPGGDVFEAHFFDSDGWARIYHTRARDRVWTFSGAHERGTIMFADDGEMMTTHWDRSVDGAVWEPLCDVTAIRARRDSTRPPVPGVRILQG